MIKGRRLIVTQEKYKPAAPSKEVEKMNRRPEDPRRKSKSQGKKVWKPSNRDGRSYKQVVEETLTETIEVQTNNEYEKDLQKAYVCYYKDNMDFRRAMEDLEQLECERLAASKFDYISCIVSKVHENQTSIQDLEPNDIECLNKVFRETKP